MPKIKGKNLNSTLKNNKTLFGEENFNGLIAKLNEEDKKVLSRPILDSSWYPIEIYVHYLEILTKSLLNGDEVMLMKGAQAVAKEQMSSIYKSFLTLKPEMFIKKIDTITKIYYEDVIIKSEFLEKNKAKITYFGFDKTHRIMEPASLGWWKSVLKVLGGKNVNVQLLTSVTDDKGCFEILVSWEN